MRRAIEPGFAPGDRSIVARLRERVVSQSSGLAAAGAHADRAILELRNFSEWIEHRIREQVRGRLVEAERNEYGAARGAVVSARIKRHAPAPRRNGDEIARADAERSDIDRIERCDGSRLDGIEHFGATRHAAGVPMLEL